MPDEAAIESERRPARIQAEGAGRAPAGPGGLALSPPAPSDRATKGLGLDEASRSAVTCAIPRTGARPAPPSACGKRAAAALGTLVVLLLALAAPAAAQGIPEPLTDTPGNPARGRAIVADRTRGLCILCHAAPLPEVRFMGNLAPDLAGVGDRLSVPELRERIVDSRRANPDTIMPPYHSLANLNRVGSGWKGTTILTEQEVEDVVAYLATLTEDGDAE